MAPLSEQALRLLVHKALDKPGVAERTSRKWRCHEIARQLARTITSTVAEHAKVWDGYAFYRGDVVINPEQAYREMMSLGNTPFTEEENCNIRQWRDRLSEKSCLTPHSWVQAGDWIIDFHNHIEVRPAGGTEDDADHVFERLFIHQISAIPDGIRYCPCGLALNLFGRTAIIPSLRRPKSWTWLRP